MFQIEATTIQRHFFSEMIISKEQKVEFYFFIKWAVPGLFFVYISLLKREIQFIHL